MASSSTALTRYRNPLDHAPLIRLYVASCLASTGLKHALAGWASQNEIVGAVHSILWWLPVPEHQRYDGAIRLRRWHRRIDHLADGRRCIEKAFAHKAKRALSSGLAKWSEWAAKEKRVKVAAGCLLLKHAFIWKWRVEWMGLCADLKRIKQQVREVVDPVAAAKHRALGRFEDGVKVRKMFERAAQHHLSVGVLKRRWGRFILEKQALQAKIDGYKRVSEEHRAKVRLWRQLELIMQQARAHARAASAFRLQAPRKAWNRWESLFDLRREGRRMLIWAGAQEGRHLDVMRRELDKAAPGVHTLGLPPHPYWLSVPCLARASPGCGAPY